MSDKTQQDMSQIPKPVLQTPGWLPRLPFYPPGSVPRFLLLPTSAGLQADTIQPSGTPDSPTEGYVPAISLTSFSLLLAPFFLASFCLSRKTIHCLPNRKSCIPDLWHTREQAQLSQEVSNPGIVWETRSGPPPSEWSKRRTLPRRAHHSLRDGRSLWRQQSLAMLSYLGSRMPHAANI